ncbi:flagellar basal body rod protein FlgC [Inquilinus limosus]|uniref:flagellar basal body rod protein FlgC n=1 Tax=Inquilinus limosus TaxID=171674 RepID=UPI003F18D738
MDPLSAAMKVGASGLRAQSLRLRVVAENVANAETTATQPGGDPYRRKTVTFASTLDRASGAELVEVRRVGTDQSAFPMSYDPGHPAADAGGYVKLPNVNTVIEMADMREASRSYEANLSVIEQARAMLSRTVDMLRG